MPRPTQPPAADRRPVRRRIRLAVALGSALAATALSGCGNPPGIDGELADDWRPVSAPTSFAPAAGSCHEAGFAATATLALYNPVDCSAGHRTETVHVGTFADAAAAGTAPPAKGSAELRAAFAECDTKATEYVGGPWRTARLWLGVALPSAEAWAGGARWFRCDMTEVTTIEDSGETADRTASLKGVLAAPSPLALTCYAVRLDKEGAIDTMPPADCAKPHNAEFAGVWNAPDGGYPKRDADWDRFHDACRKVIAGYAGVPADDQVRFRAGVVSLPAAEEQWQSGNRGVRCYLWISERPLTASVKGGGDKALPVQTGTPQ